jgi:hypothetical protein
VPVGAANIVFTRCHNAASTIDSCSPACSSLCQFTAPLYIGLRNSLHKPAAENATPSRTTPARVLQLFVLHPRD